MTALLSLRLLAAVLVALGTLTLSHLFADGGTHAGATARDGRLSARALSTPRLTPTVAATLSTGAAFSPAGDGLPRSQGVTERDLAGRLLPRTVVPSRLMPASVSTLANTEAAAYFPDPDDALAAMTAAERLGGVHATYALPVPARPDEAALAVSSSVALYRSAADAAAVLTDPRLADALDALGLPVTEVGAAPAGERSRAFRGVQAGDAPDRLTYVVTFQQANVVGTVLVVLPADHDDGGRLAFDLARAQAAT